jgi:hypothetical protein
LEVIEMNGAPLENALGSDFFDKYKIALMESRSKRIELTEDIKRLAIEAIKRDMKPTSASLNWVHAGAMYHIVLVQAAEELRTRQLEFGVSMSFKWLGKWLSAVLPETEVGKIIPGEDYVLIGRIREKKGKDGLKMYLNMTAYGVITLDEIAKYNSTISTDASATNKAMG